MSTVTRRVRKDSKEAKWQKSRYCQVGKHYFIPLQYSTMKRLQRHGDCLIWELLSKYLTEGVGRPSRPTRWPTFARERSSGMASKLVRFLFS